MPARAQQHGGVRFSQGPRQPEQTARRVCFHRARALAARGHNSTAACASAWRHVNSQGAAARRRALLSGPTPARAKQHGGVCFHSARAFTIMLYYYYTVLLHCTITMLYYYYAVQCYFIAPLHCYYTVLLSYSIALYYITTVTCIYNTVLILLYFYMCVYICACLFLPT
jgi:hypothetical protein